MGTSAVVMIAAAPVFLESYLAGRWVRGEGEGAALVDPATGEVVARASTVGLNIEGALRYAREVGQPALRALRYAQRAEMLGRIADVLAARKDEWYAIALKNSGNTRADAAIDVDGAIGTLKYFAKAGAALGEAEFLADGEPLRLARDPNFQGVHLGIPIEGAAIHINAYNFPSWGLWEKAAVALLAGIPVVAKPATATAWLAVAMTRAVVDAGMLPAGALSLVAGSTGGLLEYARFGDAIAFTGSAETAEIVRSHPHVRGAGIRVNVEADSLNASLLGPDAVPGTSAFDLFVREVAREMTSKAGQKCTAIRRAVVPAQHIDTVAAAIGAAIDAIGEVAPVVSPSSRAAVERGIDALAEGAAVVYRRAARRRFARRVGVQRRSGVSGRLRDRARRDERPRAARRPVDRRLAHRTRDRVALARARRTRPRRERRRTRRLAWSVVLPPAHRDPRPGAGARRACEPRGARVASRPGRAAAAAE